MPDAHTDNGETILVVDDNKGVRNAVISLLERANFKVLSADCGQAPSNLRKKRLTSYFPMWTLGKCPVRT